MFLIIWHPLLRAVLVQVQEGSLRTIRCLCVFTCSVLTNLGFYFYILVSMLLWGFGLNDDFFFYPQGIKDYYQSIK